MNIRRGKTISIKTTDPFSVLSIGSIRTSRTLIFRKYRNKKISRSNYLGENRLNHNQLFIKASVFLTSSEKFSQKKQMCPTGSTLRPRDVASPSHFKPAFDVLDSDRDGKISRDDLRAFYAGSGDHEGDEDAINTMISVADFNKDGYVEYDEFERVIEYGKSKSKSKYEGGLMEDMFKVMDKDGDGRLSHADLKSYMNSAGFAATDDDIKAMIKLAGGDDNEGVSFEGLLRILAVDRVGC